MKSIDNVKLFGFSLNNPEPIIDEFYVKSGDIIISKNLEEPTDVMEKNLELLESISAYSFAKKNKNKPTAKKAVENILEIVKSKNINYSEFVSFWSVVDISYSLFTKMKLKEQTDVIRYIVEKYIDSRHGLYSLHGYTATTLQVGKDAKAHKESGSLGLRKVSELLDKAGYKNMNTATLEDAVSKYEKVYIEADKKGKKLFKNILRHYKIKFSWSKNKEQKMPDFLIKNREDIFIIEHKHMKEGGGGQDKQINEIISFVSFSEKDTSIHYVSFLDGTYFNLFINNDSLREGKILNQFKNIKKHLEKNKQNYFVNTGGFKKLLEELE